MARCNFFTRSARSDIEGEGEGFVMAKKLVAPCGYRQGLLRGASLGVFGFPALPP
jgi:hypothetical protein